MYVKSRFTYDFVYGIIISRGDFMDAKQIGNIISKLRKANGYTQAALAKKLNVSDKTVSKWESGLGYPEITQFPILASLFGVSIDYLMTGDRVGISVAGNMIVDAVKCIEEYPKIGMLAEVGSLIIDKSLIKGSVGAGDAFCAGALYGIYNEYSDREMLEFASAAAVCNLFEVNSVDGMRNKDEIKKIMNKYGRVEI